MLIRDIRSISSFSTAPSYQPAEVILMGKAYVAGFSAMGLYDESDKRVLRIASSRLTGVGVLLLKPLSDLIDISILMALVLEGVE